MKKEKLLSQLVIIRLPCRAILLRLPTVFCYRRFPVAKEMSAKYIHPIHQSLRPCMMTYKINHSRFSVMALCVNEMIYSVKIWMKCARRWLPPEQFARWRRNCVCVCERDLKQLCFKREFLEDIVRQEKYAFHYSTTSAVLNFHPTSITFVASRSKLHSWQTKFMN